MRKVTVEALCWLLGGAVLAYSVALFWLLSN
jgi:hypothetical protein